jgi:hypothetical protein
MEESVIQGAILSAIKDVGKKNMKVFESLKQYIGMGLSSGNPDDNALWNMTTKWSGRLSNASA